MPLLAHFDPADVNPDLFVDRETDRAWLYDRLQLYLQTNIEEPSGRAFCILGDKGSGKSIYTRRVLKDLRRDHGGLTALFVTVDCRMCHNRRGVLKEVVWDTLKELLNLEKVNPGAVDASIIDTARILHSFASSTSVTITNAHSQTYHYGAALKLRGEQSLLSLFKASADFTLEVDERRAKEQVSKIELNDDLLNRAVCALFCDIRAAHIHVVLYIDNIDELDHRYEDEKARLKVRQDIETILNLGQAPIALVLNMRTYISGVMNGRLARPIQDRLSLEPLESTILASLVQVRLDKERAEIGQALAPPSAKAAMEQLTRMANSPLSLLIWVKFVVEEDGLAPERVPAILEKWIKRNYATVRNLPLIKRVAAAFRDREEITRQELLDVCQSEGAMTLLIDRMAVLPVDFWNPIEFTLDPELHFLKA